MAPHGRENRAAVAISSLEIDKGAGNAVTPRRPHMRPLKLGTPKRELESTKASGWDGNVRVTTPTTPQTPPRRRPPKLGRPKAELDIMKPTKSDNETRSVTPDSHGHARSPNPKRTKIDVASNEARDQGATPAGPRRRPPEHGPPKAGRVNGPSQFNSAKAETATPDTKFQSAKAKTSTPTIELKSAEPETNLTTPRFDSAKPDLNTIAPEFKNDHATANASSPCPDIAQAEVGMVIPMPDSAKAGTPAAPESNSAKAETSGTAPNLTTAPELEIEQIGGATPGQSRPRKLGRPKAEAESQGHNAKIELGATTLKSESLTGKTRSMAPNLGKPPETEISGADDLHPEDRRPMPKPPKLGRPKAELGSQKPMKLVEKDERSTPEKPYTEHPKLGYTKADPESQKPEKLAKKDAKSTPGKPYAEQPRLRNTKAGPESQKPEKLAKKDEKSTPEKPYTEHPELGDVKADPESQGADSEQAAKRTDREPKDAMPHGSSLQAEGKNNLEKDTTPPTTRKRPAKLEKPKAELGPTKSNKVAKKEEGAQKSTVDKPANAEPEFREIDSEQARNETDEKIGGNAPPDRPHPKPPAPEVDGGAGRNEGVTLPAGRARPPKLGRPRAGQENSKAERESTVTSKLARKVEK